MSTAARRAALMAAVASDADAVIVTKLVNVRYLTGFTGSNGAVLVRSDGDAVLATDGRYRQQAGKEAPDVEVQITRSLASDLITVARERGAQRIAIERQHVTLMVHDALIEAAGSELDFVDAGQAVEKLRTRKDDAELAALRTACAITDSAFATVLELLAPGVTERDIAWALLSAMRGGGADGAAFDSIVAFGSHSAIPHHQPTDRPLERGDLVKVDFGAQVAGYHADMTRTVVVGPAADWQRELHAQVMDVQARCREATEAGALPLDLDQLAQKLVVETGHTLIHGLGHGVGLEIHEQPFLVPGSAAPPLEDLVPLTVEPGIYLPERGGVRIEDIVLVGAGGVEVLTRSPRELIEV
jgi:Xaa-Pro aminopeptidase